MRLDISSKNLVRLEVNGLSLKCYFHNGNVTFHSLEGITELWCFNNQLQSLPVLPDGLKELQCFNNQLQSLPVLPNGLNGLYCYNNQLQSLPVLPNNLILLYCYDNQLQSLPKLPKTLGVLGCSSNQLRSLPVLPNGLTELFCYNNQLQSLPVLPGTLEVLYCSKNPLVFIRPLAKRPEHYQVPENLEDLYVQKNYCNYYKKHQTYVYLITYLVIEMDVSLVLASREQWSFFDI